MNRGKNGQRRRATPNEEQHFHDLKSPFPGIVVPAFSAPPTGATGTSRRVPQRTSYARAHRRLGPLADKPSPLCRTPCCRRSWSAAGCPARSAHRARRPGSVARARTTARQASPRRCPAPPGASGRRSASPTAIARRHSRPARPGTGSRRRAGRPRRAPRRCRCSTPRRGEAR